MGKLLIVVDYQKDFVDGALGFEKAKELEDKIYDKVERYLSEGEKVLFTYDTHFDDYLKTREGIHLPVVHCIKGTSGHNLYGKLNEFKDDDRVIHIEKLGFGIAPESMVKLKEKIGDIEEIELVGIVTNMCVVSNVVTFQSSYVNAEITVDGNLCASFDQELHEKALDVIQSLQVKVIR